MAAIYKTVAGQTVVSYTTVEEKDAALQQYYEAYLQQQRTSVPRASSTSVQQKLSEVHRNLAAENAVIPICYGECQIGGRPFAIDYSSGQWTIGYMLCIGEIDSITAVYLNGATKPVGVTVNEYTGTTTQTVDSLLSTAISGYSDDLVIDLPNSGKRGIAYIVVQYTDDDFSDWPKVVVELKGLKCWNPSTSTTVYTDNPALHLGDLLSNTEYGLGATVDDTALESAMDYCDDTTPTEARRKSYTIINSVRDTEDWIEVLRLYASCWIAYRGGTAILIPDKSGSSVMSIGAGDMVQDSLKITKKDSEDLPTVIRATYTDTSDTIWRERLCDAAKATGVDTGATPWRESRLRLTGINRHSQAYRECVERLNKLTLSDLEISFIGFDDLMPLEIGDIISVTHPYGLTNKLCRLTDDPRQVSPGRWRINAIEYDPAAYSDTVQSQSTYSDGTLPGAIWGSGIEADGATTFREPPTPSANAAGDIWFDSTDNDHEYRATAAGTGNWVSVRDGTIADAQADATQALADAATAIANAATAQSTADGKVVTFFQSVIPTGDTGDLWIRSTDNQLFRADSDGSDQIIAGEWETVQDQDIATAISDAATAQATADGKIVTFYQAATPTGDEGDLWIRDTDNKMFRAMSDGSDQIVAGEWEEVQDNDIAQAITDASNAQATADGKITTFFQAGIPTGDLGDLWVRTSDNQLFRADSDNSNEITTGEWESVQDLDIAQAISDAADAQSTADGKIETFYGSSPPSANAIGDFWVDTSGGGNELYRASATGTGNWVSVRDGTIATAQATAEGKSTCYYGTDSSAISGMDDGDIFININTGIKEVYETNQWVERRDTTNDYSITGIQSGTSFNAVLGGVYPIDASSNAVTMNLPAGSQNARVYFMEYNGSWGENEVKVSPDGSEKIMGLAEDMICDQSNFNGSVVYIDSTVGWVVAS